MKPEIDQILNLSAMKIIGEFAPAMAAQYEQGMAQVVAGLMLMSAQEYDRAADIRVAENQDMRVLFAELASQISDAGLRGELEAAAETREGSLRISALNAANETLRRLLIRLHAQFDDMGADASRIWSVLKTMAARRTVTLPG
ncbi:MAG TPA: hypothetical protein VGM36_13960 [Rhizomicrobium sp.]|jgi:hypothetical protein